MDIRDMEIKVGTIFKVKTSTKDDVFGECIWEVISENLPAPERDRAGMMDGVRCVLLGGSGPAARAGYTVKDSVFAIRNNIRKGICWVMPPEKKAELVKSFAGRGTPQSPARKSSGCAGCIEV